jgi:hypothetical protein
MTAAVPEGCGAQEAGEIAQVASVPMGTEAACA